MYFLRIIEATAPLVRMIINILYDMKAFMILFFLVIFAFASGFYFLAKNQDENIDTS